MSKHLDVLIQYKNKPRVNEFHLLPGNQFEHVDFERGEENVRHKFSNRESFVKHVCKSYVGMIPKYENSWT